MSQTVDLHAGTSRRAGGATWITVLLLGAAAGLHFWLTTGNWRAGFLPGHEFRQTHTAIITHYIDQEDNFRPIYTVPLFGPPWVCPMEFPLYEWSVVGVSRATGWPHHVAARTVTLTCFYLMLPAFYLLLGDAGLPWRRRVPALALVLCCPVYIFYSRSFLMESMALMGAVWFLASFIRVMRGGRAGWLLLAAASGTMAGLIKSTTLFVWLVPAAAYGVLCLVRAARERNRGWAPVFRVLGRGLGAAALPCASVYWWVHYSDMFKVNHPSAYIFASGNLSQGNFGLLDLGARFSPDTWGLLFDRWGEAIAAPGLILGVVAVGAVLLPRERARILVATGLFLLAQLLFPFAYALQEYYFYACAVFILAALGFVWNGVLDAEWPAWPRRGFLAVLLCAPFVLLATYAREYRALQLVPSNGGSGLTEALRAFTPPGSVIVVIGKDWAPDTAYYSQRKALMVRRGLEYDREYLARALADLADENVSALVMANEHRGNAELARWIAERVGLDPEPTFSHPTANVHVSELIREQVIFLATSGEGGGSGYEGIVAEGKPAARPRAADGVAIPPALAATSFEMITPAVVRGRFTYGFARWNLDGESVLGAHPDTDLWVPVAPGARHIVWEFGIFPGAHAQEGAQTSGVEFIVMVERSDGSQRQLARRVLNPAVNPADRGRQRAEVAFDAAEGETVVFQTRPHGGPEFDWAYIRRIDIR